MMSSLRPITENDREWMRSLWMKWWSAPFVVSKDGKIHHVDDMAGFIALKEGKPIGLITYTIVNTECEITSLISLLERVGIGTRLLQRLEVEAQKKGCRRIWVITTNDNVNALGWYQKRGYRLSALYRGAMNTVRQLKLELALQGLNDIPLQDMIELEKILN
jgi:ribosomal protein S18 acetylase RimI-like enzyme